MADLDAQELEELRDLAAKRSGAGKQTIKTMLKAAQQEHADQAGQAGAQRAVPPSAPIPVRRFQIPTVDAPWLPQMQMLDEVLGSSPAKRPPTRDIDDDITRARKLRVPNTHAFTKTPMPTRGGVTQMTKLPAPEQWVLSKMNEMEVAEMIERYIDYVDEERQVGPSADAVRPPLYAA